MPALSEYIGRQHHERRARGADPEIIRLGDGEMEKIVIVIAGIVVE